MTLTKAEFDRLKAQADEAAAYLNDRPTVPEVATITLDGRLLVSRVCLTITETRALYEMLRAWYGEDAPSPAMTEKAKAVIDLIGRTLCVQWPRELIDAYNAYRAEQKQ